MDNHEPCYQHTSVMHSLEEGTKIMAALQISQARMEEKLDAMSERQIKYMLQTTELKTIVTNGLSTNVETLATDVKTMTGKIDTICENFGKRLVALESFQWFRDIATKFRDRSFVYILYIVVVGSLALTGIHFGSQLLNALLKGLVK